MLRHSDRSTLFGAGAIVDGDYCHGRGRNCVLNGDRGVLHDGDGAVINGNHWVVMCADPASITDNGHGNSIVCTAALDTAQFYERCVSGNPRRMPAARPLPTRVTLVWRGRVLAVYDARTTVAARIEAARRHG